MAMASVQKRGNKFAVVYSYNDINGEKRQKWETFTTKKQAQVRRSEVEYEINTGSFIPPSAITVRELLKDFVELYGTKRWGLSAYTGNTALIDNYINPLLGDYNVQQVTPRVADLFAQRLQQICPVKSRKYPGKSKTLPASTVENIFKLLHCAWHQAVRWDIVVRNPFDNALIPKPEKKRRDIWTADTIRKALDSCPDGKLFIAINMAFACSLRLGEITGLTWDCVHISDQDIARDDAHLYVEKELSRVNTRAIEALGEADILYMFPHTSGRRSSTELVLKRPKTESSIRKVWIPKTLAYILRDWQEKQEKLKEFMGCDYEDYNLVVALETGRPCEDRVIGNQFARLKKNAGLPNVVFHSLRHSSTTYKLKLNHGDIKATQGDTGHSQASMVTEVYAHILDEERKINAQRFEAAFYANPDMRQTERELNAKRPEKAPTDLQGLLHQLQQNPELTRQLRAILNT